jgi:hypothetical protein
MTAGRGNAVECPAQQLGSPTAMIMSSATIPTYLSQNLRFHQAPAISIEIAPQPSHFNNSIYPYHPTTPTWLKPVGSLPFSRDIADV